MHPISTRRKVAVVAALTLTLWALVIFLAAGLIQTMGALL